MEGSVIKGALYIRNNLFLFRSRFIRGVFIKGYSSFYSALNLFFNAHFSFPHVKMCPAKTWQGTFNYCTATFGN